MSLEKMSVCRKCLCVSIRILFGCLCTRFFKKHGPISAKTFLKIFLVKKACMFGVLKSGSLGPSGGC